MSPQDLAEFVKLVRAYPVLTGMERLALQTLTGLEVDGPRDVDPALVPMRHELADAAECLFGAHDRGQWLVRRLRGPSPDAVGSATVVAVTGATVEPHLDRVIREIRAAGLASTTAKIEGDILTVTSVGGPWSRSEWTATMRLHPDTWEGLIFADGTSLVVNEAGGEVVYVQGVDPDRPGHPSDVLTGLLGDVLRPRLAAIAAYRAAVGEADLARMPLVSFQGPTPVWGKTRAYWREPKNRFGVALHTNVPWGRFHFGIEKKKAPESPSVLGFEMEVVPRSETDGGGLWKVLDRLAWEGVESLRETPQYQAEFIRLMPAAS